jgi:hypothetical protein
MVLSFSEGMKKAQAEACALHNPVKQNLKGYTKEQFFRYYSSLPASTYSLAPFFHNLPVS